MNERIKKIEEILLRMSESDEKRKKESEKERKEREKERKEREKERKEREKERKEREKERKEDRKSMNDLKKMFDWMWYTQWMITEDLVWENFQDVLNETGESISSTQRNIEVFEWKRKVAEFDIIWVNGTKVFIWETKTKLTKNHIDKFVTKTLPNFKKYLLEKRYAWLKMYWVMWARVFESDKTKDYAISKWLYVMKESHKGNLKMIKKSIKNAKVFA